ncbi:TetR family transcriptional regulator [Pedobacter lusitanus]|uniref:TetR family transcriptional regulator n=1 Tax=Pedobacter lusitanus TaxID=1503925 RepID=A0A0D0FX50_9SPHI|nr:TetR/AcrR family transcriptional regulator [Pedobacter lusitanus]KIO77094.1 TetR family transcriptional regulator [Pedobacter lusitanus]
MARNKEFDVTERLGKAKDLFWEKGYNATSMQDLVNAMALNPGSIYGTFGGKHQLFIESLKLYSKQTLDEYENAAAQSKSPFGSVKAIIQKAIERAFTENKACMVVKSSFELASVDTDTHRLLKQQTTELISFLEKLLKLGQESGEVNPDKDVKVMATFIVASFAGFWHMQVLLDDQDMAIATGNFLIESLQ